MLVPQDMSCYPYMKKLVKLLYQKNSFIGEQHRII